MTAQVVWDAPAIPATAASSPAGTRQHLSFLVLGTVQHETTLGVRRRSPLALSWRIGNGGGGSGHPVPSVVSQYVVSVTTGYLP